MTTELAVLLLSCAAAGVVDAIGGGGGMLTIPAFLSAGVPLPLLLGTNKATACVGSTAALLRYARAGLMPRLRPGQWGALCAVAVLSAGFGALLSQTHWILDRLRIGIPLLLLLVMGFLSWKWFGPGSKARPETSDTLKMTGGNLAGIGGVSAYDGLFGPGTGTFFLSFLEARGLPTLRANAFSKVLNVCSNLGALIWFSFQGAVIWRLGLMGAVAYLVGNFTGSGLVLSQGQKIVRYTTLFMTSLLLLRNMWALSR